MLLLTDGESEYKVDITKDTINLSPINVLKDEWSDKGLKINNLLFETGNGIEITLQGRKIKLNYSEQEHLYLLLRIWKQKFESGPKQRYRFIETNELEELE